MIFNNYYKVYYISLGLGTQTVIRFAEKLEHPSRHRLFLTTSLVIVFVVRDEASGTVKVNRI